MFSSGIRDNGGMNYLWVFTCATLLAAATAPGCASSSKSQAGDEAAEESREAEKEDEKSDEQKEAQEQQDKKEAQKQEQQKDDSKRAKTGRSQKTGEELSGDLKGAVEAARKGDRESAISAFEGLTDDPDEGHFASYNLGVIYEKQGKPEEAANFYSQALEKKPKFTSALINLVRVYLREGRADKAEEVAEKFIQRASDHLDHRAAELEVLLYREKYDSVISRAKDILRRDERNVEAMVAMARANYWLGRYELAEEILNRANSLSPDRADVFFLYGVIAMENDENERAITNLKEALKHHPQLAEAHNNLGLLYYEAGDFEGAAEQFEAALDDHPEFKEARLNLGNAYKNLGKLEKAEVQFEKVAEMDGEYADAYFNLGVLYLDADIPGMKKIPRLEKAVEKLKQYKEVAGTPLPKDDPANKYIKSAREKIKAEKQKRKMRRRMQKQAGGGGGDGKDGSNGSGGSDSSGGDGSDGSDGSAGDGSTGNGDK